MLQGNPLLFYHVLNIMEFDLLCFTRLLGIFCESEATTFISLQVIKVLVPSFDLQVSKELSQLRLILWSAKQHDVLSNQCGYSHATLLFAISRYLSSVENVNVS